MAPSTNTKILLLGLDAMDAVLVRRWTEAGKLPVLSSLMARGRAGAMPDLPALWTGGVWPSLITGCSPARHGYFYYHGYDPATYVSSPNHERGYDVPPFWEALSAAGRRVAILDVPLAPLSQGLDGIQLADWGLHEPEGPVRSWPPPLAADILDRFGAEPVGQCDNNGRGPSDFSVFRDRLLERIETRTALYGELIQAGGWDLVFGAFSESHCAGHQCWHLHDPGHPRHDAALAREVGDPVLDVYRALDRAVGRLVELAGPGALVLVVAAHGMGASHRAYFDLDRILQEIEGVKAPRSRLLGTLDSRWKRMPERWRARLRPVGRRVKRRLSPGARGTRKCFEMSSQSGHGAIRVNLEGREPTGRVAAADFPGYCEWLRERLLELVASDTGERVVRRVWRISDHYERSAGDRLPDLVVEWERDVVASAVASPATGVVRAVSRGVSAPRTGDHRPHGGLLVACGPGITPGRIESEPTVLDVAPTILAALGMRVGRLDGSPVVELTPEAS